MTGTIRSMIDQLVEKRAKGNPLVVETTKAKLFFKGINVESFDRSSPDDPLVEERIREIAADWGVAL